MKKLKILALTISFLTLVCTNLIAQSSAEIIPDSNSQIVTNEQAVGIMLAEIEDARLLIRANNERIAALENNLAVEEQNSGSLSRSYEAAKSEIGALRAANIALEKAIASQRQTIALLTAEMDKAKQNAKKWKKRAFKIGLAFGLSVLLRAIKNDAAAVAAKGFSVQFSIERTRLRAAPLSSARCRARRQTTAPRRGAAPPPPLPPRAKKQSVGGCFSKRFNF